MDLNWIQKRNNISLITIKSKPQKGSLCISNCSVAQCTVDGTVTLVANGEKARAVSVQQNKGGRHTKPDDKGRF
ncbi:hypothetical protein BX666DRAFT_1976821 [Dichotomocladium elegans]|nr:hypothetical protein BX666DRAFT_1976821 [Dichotomocladium elegans]